MIKKEVITMQSEAWFSEDRQSRYVLRKQWYEGVNEDKTGKLAVVITIRPTSTSAFVEDLTSMLIEKNIRQLGFTGFIAVNLFSSIHAENKATFLKGSDENTLEGFQQCLKRNGLVKLFLLVVRLSKLILWQWNKRRRYSIYLVQNKRRCANY